jgi:biotin operon repressor
MGRQDRLMRLMNALRRLPAPVTAARLAAETEISRRQLYRDVATLRAGGALIDGAAGVGYSLAEDPALPPQSFSRLEIEALMLGVGGLDHLGDAALARAGRDAVARMIATLPDRQARQAMHTVMRAWRPTETRPDVAIDMDLLRRACWDETSLWMRYRDLQDRRTEREVWPLGLSYGPEALCFWPSASCGGTTGSSTSRGWKPCARAGPGSGRAGWSCCASTWRAGWRTGRIGATREELVERRPFRRLPPSATPRVGLENGMSCMLPVDMLGDGDRAGRGHAQASAPGRRVLDPPPGRERADEQPARRLGGGARRLGPGPRGGSALRRAC